MEQSLTIHSEPQERGYILSLSGRLDTLGARELDETIGKLPEQPNLHLLLDMKNVTFLSSAGIRILIKSYKQCHNNGGECILAHVPAQAAGVLKMVGLKQLITGTEQQPTITQQEREQANILFQWQSLHQETGNFIRYEAENNKAPTFGPYDLNPIAKRSSSTLTAPADKIFPAIHTLHHHSLPLSLSTTSEKSKLSKLSQCLLIISMSLNSQRF